LLGVNRWAARVIPGGSFHRCPTALCHIASIGREPGGGLIVMPDAFTTVHRKLIIEQAAVHRLPVIYPYHYQAVEGGLMAYGVDTVDLLRRAATYVDRILKDGQGADLLEKRGWEDRPDGVSFASYSASSSFRTAAT
jgi:hypothetical protein